MPKPVFMPFVSDTNRTVIWQGDAPDGIENGERRGETRTTGHGWNALTGYRALAVDVTETGVYVYGDRELSGAREDGYCLTGTVSVGKKRRAFTSSRLFLVNGNLVDIAILYLC